MAAPAGKTQEGSSSSDDEELKRCREAVWETQANKTKDGDSDVKKSKRVVVADHEHDGNELQVTRGFQTHVAKKLQHFLNSCISEMQPETPHGLEPTDCDHENQDEGFRLFSTSVPGQKTDPPPPPAPVRRRPAPSSSDSDSEMETRLREAAVSVKDLLPSATLLPASRTPSSTETPGLGKVQKRNKVEGEGQYLKKRKKRNEEESEQADSAGSAPDQSDGLSRNSEQEHEQARAKRKKKRKQKENPEEEPLN
ncbi:protein CUSTOS [Kryptolebias marmoratus]|uniref:protein CUSTOS n=1 Tax=Kryptolebias marmoratus TaxID=37003 RepID=UPI0007F89572|nr:protein CUSTOS [Kryptolebias marmoratus]